VFAAPVEIAVGSFEDITTALDQRTQADGAVADDAARGSAQQSDDDIESLRDLASGAPVVRALNDLLERAVELRASDIHIEPFRTGLVVRMRVDGLLRRWRRPPAFRRRRLISRSRFSPASTSRKGACRRTAPRGCASAARARCSCRHHADAARRKCRHRLLPPIAACLEMSKLGLFRRRRRDHEPAARAAAWHDRDHGATGNGKTTTLATMLSILRRAVAQDPTIEDPVEYEIPGTPSPGQAVDGLTFASRARLRAQDPT